MPNLEAVLEEKKGVLYCRIKAVACEKRNFVEVCVGKESYIMMNSDYDRRQQPRLAYWITKDLDRDVKAGDCFIVAKVDDSETLARIHKDVIEVQNGLIEMLKLIQQKPAL